MKTKLTLIALFSVIAVFSQTPSYYNDVNLTLTGSALKTELATKIINTHTTNLSYTPGVWDALKQTDLDPNNSLNVFLLYGYNDADGNYVTDRTRGKDLNGGTSGTQWNREHTYPKSLGTPNLGTSGPGADAHQLRASDITMNSNRGNLLYITGSGNAGVTGSGWYPGDEWKGDVARMMMYMYLRYDTRCLPSGVTIGSTNSTDTNMIDLLLDWNAADPVSAYETQRNTILESIQGNRNPFIDNPAFATTIWGGTQAEDKFTGTGGNNCSDLFFSEYLEGSSNNKYLEIYNPTGATIDLSTYDIVSYTNGSSTVSNTLSLSGNIASYTTFVIENSSENLGVTADLSTTNGVMSFNGDDAVALRKNTTIIDVIGQIGTDPGNEWTGTTCNTGTANGVLRRKATVSAGDTNGSDAFNPDTEWTCAASDNVTDLGSYTNNCASSNPEIDLQGNSISIANGTTATNTSNQTDFGSTTTVSGTIVKTFTILNTGTATLTLSGNPTISGTNSGDFTISTNPITSISSGGSTSFSITFDPNADGIRTAIITINSDDADEGVYTFNIQGTGTTSGGGTGCDELFISEYHEGSSNNKYLEIYNPTGATIDLSTYDIVSYTNGSSTVSNTLSLSGNIASYTTFVIENSSENLGVTADLSTTNGVMSFNGDDAVALRKNTTIIDVIGQIGTDPGNEWTGTTCNTGTANGVLRRKASVSAGDTNGSDAFNPDTEWVCAASNDVTNLGSYTNNCASSNPEIDLQGNSISIADGTTTTNTSNQTDFGIANTVSGSIIKTFTILNTGTATLTLSGNPAISGTNSGDFTISTNPITSISSGGSTSFSITFDPNADGIRTAIITINSDDADEGVYTFNIQGTGTSSVQACDISTGGVLYQQDFEASPASPILTYTGTSTTTSSGNGSFPSSPMYVSGSQGLKVSNTTGTIEFATLDASSASNVSFSVRLASFAGTSGNGAETTDYVKVFVSIDSGTTYSEELTITGASANNARWSFTSGTGTATTTYDGNNTTSTFAPTGTGNRTTDGYSTLNINGLPSSATLRVKIELKNNSTNEIWAVDDAIFTADTESKTTWNGTTWSDGEPTATVKAIINGNYDMTINPSINSCEFEIKSGNTVTIESSKFLTIEGNLINNGSIIVNSDGSLVQISSSATITGSGSYLVKRNTTSLPSKNVFTYWSSPLKNSTLQEVVSGARSYYSFVPVTQGWKSETSASTMIPGMGYITQGDPGITYPNSYTANFTGAEFNSGNVTITTSYNNDANVDNDWNLVGNPYPSAINADAFIAANSSVLGGTLYFWTHNTDASFTSNFSQNDYVSWNATGGTAGCSGCIAPINSIASGQGFFVSTIASGNVTFTNAMRLSGENTNFYKTNVVTEKDKIWLNFFGENMFSQILIGFLENATDNVDQKYDGLRLNSGVGANFYSIIDNAPYAIQGKKPLTDTEEIPLGFTTTKTGNLTISIDHLKGKLDSSNVFLIDNSTTPETVHDLKDSNYNFSVTSIGTFDNRFVLKITSALNVLDIDEVTQSYTKLIFLTNSNNQIEITTSNKKLISTVLVYDLLGRNIITQKNKIENTIILSKKIKSNTLVIVKAILEDGTILTQKLYQNL